MENVDEPEITSEDPSKQAKSTVCEKCIKNQTRSEEAGVQSNASCTCDKQNSSHSNSDNNHDNNESSHGKSDSSHDNSDSSHGNVDTSILTTHQHADVQSTSDPEAHSSSQSHNDEPTLHTDALSKQLLKCHGSTKLVFKDSTKVNP